MMNDRMNDVIKRKNIPGQMIKALDRLVVNTHKIL